MERPDAPRRISARLNSVFGGPTWMPDGRSVLVREVPADLGPAPAAPAVPGGPNVQETSGQKSPLRTYQDLLKGAYDEQLFAHYARSELAHYDLESGERRAIGAADFYVDAEPSPDAQHILVTRFQRALVLPSCPGASFRRASRCGAPQVDPSTSSRICRWVRTSRSGAFGPVRAWFLGSRACRQRSIGPRRSTAADPKAEVEHRDRWLALDAPFEGEPRELVRLEERAWGLTYFDNPSWILTREYDRDRPLDSILAGRSRIARVRPARARGPQHSRSLRRSRRDRRAT